MECDARFVLICVIAVRLSSVFLVQTWFVPDEYWQSLEVAHYLTFGYGYLTWEWFEGIRSLIYPGAIAICYKLITLLGFELRILLVIYTNTNLFRVN